MSKIRNILLFLLISSCSGSGSSGDDSVTSGEKLLPDNLEENDSYYLSPQILGAEKFPAETVSVAPSANFYLTHPSLLSTPNNTIKIDLYYSKFYVKPFTNNRWRASYSESLDAAIQPSELDTSANTYSTPTEACKLGWQQISSNIYNGDFYDKIAEYNDKRRLCEIKDATNSSIFLNRSTDDATVYTVFPIRNSKGKPIAGTHILRTADDNFLLFERDWTSNKYYSALDKNIILQKAKLPIRDTTDSRVFKDLQDSTQDSWQVGINGSKLYFDGYSRLAAVKDSEGNILKKLFYGSTIQNNKQLKVTTVASIEGEKMQIFYNQENKIDKIISLEKTQKITKLPAYNYNRKNAPLYDATTAIFNYNSSGNLEYVSFVDNLNVKLYSYLYLNYITLNGKNILSSYSNPLETITFNYNNNKLQTTSSMNTGNSFAYLFNKNEVLKYKYKTAKVISYKKYELTSKYNDLINRLNDSSDPKILSNQLVSNLVKKELINKDNINLIAVNKQATDDSLNYLLNRSALPAAPQIMSVTPENNIYLNLPEVTEFKNALNLDLPVSNQTGYPVDCEGFKSFFRAVLKNSLTEYIGYGEYFQAQPDRIRNFLVDNCYNADTNTYNNRDGSLLYLSPIEYNSLITTPFYYRQKYYSYSYSCGRRCTSTDYKYEYYIKTYLTLDDAIVYNDNYKYNNDNKGGQVYLPTDTKKEVNYPPYRSFLKNHKFRACAYKNTPEDSNKCVFDEIRTVPIDICGSNTIIVYFAGYLYGAPGPGANKEEIKKSILSQLKDRKKIDLNCYSQFILLDYYHQKDGNYDKGIEILRNASDYNKMVQKIMLDDDPANDATVANKNPSEPKDKQIYKRIIFIGHSFGGHASIKQTMNREGLMPDVIITLDPVVNMATSNLSEVLNKLDVINVVWTFMETLIADIFNLCLNFFDIVLNLLEEILGTINNVYDAGKLSPNYYNYWYSIRASINGTDGDESPFIINIPTHKECLGPKDWGVCVNVPENVEILIRRNWNASDGLAYLGGKYYSFPENRADMYENESYHHDGVYLEGLKNTDNIHKEDSMLQRAIKILNDKNIIIYQY